MSSTETGEIRIRCFGLDFETSCLEWVTTPPPKVGDIIRFPGRDYDHLVKAVDIQDDGWFSAEAWVVSKHMPRGDAIPR